MRIFLTGASGYLGYFLTRYFESQSLAASPSVILGTWHTRSVTFPSAVSQHLDFRNPAEAYAAMLSFKPTHVVHAGALTSTVDCERAPAAAFETNIVGTQSMLDAAMELRPLPHFIYISTDLVFDGRTGNYSEDDLANPSQVYGRTKLEAEQLVAQYPGLRTSVRSSLIYGPHSDGRSCFLDWMLEGIRKGTQSFFADEYRTPVYIVDLCRAIDVIAARGAVGTYHVAGPDRTSRHEFALLAADVFDLPRDQVKSALLSETKLVPERPPDVSLDISLARQALGYSPRTTYDGLRAVYTKEDDILT